MSKSNRVAIGLATVCLAMGVGPVCAQKIEATVLFRQNADTYYNAVVPGYSIPAADGSGYVDCAADPTDAACASAGSDAAKLSAGDFSLNVVGTTVSLLLPDGRVAVVNCVNKYSSRGTSLNRRDCGMPLVEHVQAEFKGRIARLEWALGTDGRKTESETYRVVAVLDKRQAMLEKH